MKQQEQSDRTSSRKRKREVDDIDTLEQKIKDLDTDDATWKAFDQLPLSKPTIAGLEASHYKTLTEIQKTAIPSSLKGRDVLGAAKTGSGKTLAFLVPVLENLLRKKWSEHDGLGALILSPTRDLAIQIFEVLRKIGRYHTFSAGLVIGGKPLQEERMRMSRMNILVCTPGRMLQHLDQTVDLEAGNLQMLVLDEADRILDMGFKETVDAIIDHIPKQRQTLLFSATQTRKVSDLGRLSLRDPKYISVHEEASSATPTGLQQNYIVTPLPNKLDTLWGFLRSNLKSKILVFLSSGKQVRFVFEAFRHMQPGIPLMHLYGRQKQTARLDIVTKFSTSRASCLFSTDVAARGLDFPAVDWVIQLDCPEDADTYIHRVGRTARYDQIGRAVLFLDPTEEKGMLDRLEQKRVHLEKISVRQKKQQSIKGQLQNMCFKDPELRYLAQKAFISYVRSIRVQKDKEIFKLGGLAIDEFSASLGLPGPPKIKLGNDDFAKARALKNAPRELAQEMSEPQGQSEVRTKYDRMFDRTNQNILAGHYTRLIDKRENASSLDTVMDDDPETFLSAKRTLNSASLQDEADSQSPSEDRDENVKVVTGVTKDPLLIDSKRREKLLKSKKKLLKFKERAKKLVYDEDGNAHEIYELEDEEKFKARGPANDQKATFLDTEQQRLQAVDANDKLVARAKRKEKREKRKAAERAQNGEAESVGAQLAEGNEAILSVPQARDELDEMNSETEAPPRLLETQSRKVSKGNDPGVGHAARDVTSNLDDLEVLASGIFA